MRPCRSSASSSSAGPSRSLLSLSKGREARDHLGLETQRQWSDRAIARTTPCRLGLFSLTTRLGSRLSTHTKRAVAAAAWYRKTQPTFADTLAAVRKEIWAAQGFSMSRTKSDSRKLSSRLRDGIAYAFAMPHDPGTKWPKSNLAADDLSHVSFWVRLLVLLCHFFIHQRALLPQTAGTSGQRGDEPEGELTADACD